MKLLSIASIALALSVSLGAASAQAKKAPAAEPPAASEKSPDMQASAKKDLDAWQNGRRECFQKAGLVEGRDWRFRPDNPLKTQISNGYWLNGGKDPECR